MNISLLFVILLSLYTISLVKGSVMLAPMFQNGAIIQLSNRTTIWGWVMADGAVNIAIDGISIGDAIISGMDERCSVRKWMIEFSSLQYADGPHKITVSLNGAPLAEANDIMFGHVLICSGQSNMLHGANDFVQDSMLDPLIRLYAFDPDRNDHSCLANNPPFWMYANERWVAGYSPAVCFFAALQLRKSLGKPVGIMRAASGGKEIDQFFPTGMVYENMLTHLRNVTALAFIYYQGEADVTFDKAPVYESKLRALVEQVRQLYRPACSGLLPFGVHQLPGPWAGADLDSMNKVMTAQATVGNTVPQAFTVISQNVTTDAYDLHPKTGKDKTGLQIGDILATRFKC